VGTSLGVCASIVWAITTYITPQMDILRQSRAAICGGDQSFVYSVDAAGGLSWSYPRHLDVSSTTFDIDWVSDPSERLTFLEYAMDAVVAGNGRTDCPSELCYDAEALVPVPIDGRLRAPCCIPRQTKVPDIDGGVFSVQAKASLSVEEANDM
jgi:hypothetical protein